MVCSELVIEIEQVLVQQLKEVFVAFDVAVLRIDLETDIGQILLRLLEPPVLMVDLAAVVVAVADSAALAIAAAVATVAGQQHHSEG